ncbi:hypothetical protein GHT06_013412 [Daphnia sinensis]|uniref:HAT C-terminal dimerisation domain-containing protein n=1 Tax=Daphnia sinensis TaxID=1820382 RepID=A0AAD5PWZ3_9CRUS|nr:hypothetical protein GHT06_013412 [Daphnia sinensis]
MLNPFDEVTTDLSSQYYPSISKVIPSIRILQHNLGALNITGCCPILKKMSSDLLTNINDRFHITTEKSTVHLVTTFLDPSEMAEKRVERELRLAINQGSTEDVAVKISSLPNTCRSFHDSMIRAVNTARTGESSDVTTCVTVNIRDILRKPYLPWSTDPLDKFFFSATSVPSDMLFSAAGDLIREKRSRLSADHVDMLLFLNRNAKKNYIFLFIFSVTGMQIRSSTFR